MKHQILPNPHKSPLYRTYCGVKIDTALIRPDEREQYVADRNVGDPCPECYPLRPGNWTIVGRKIDGSYLVVNELDGTQIHVTDLREIYRDPKPGHMIQIGPDGSVRGYYT